jgi:hypothetical protein
MSEITENQQPFLNEENEGIEKRKKSKSKKILEIIQWKL